MERVIYERIQALEQDHWWFAGRRAILERLIGDLGLPADARILEAGCGAGGNLRLLSRFGTVRAMEPDEPSRRYVAEHWGVQVDHGLLPDGLPYPPQSFDAVACFDVIEHVDDDEGAGLKVRRASYFNALLFPAAAAVRILKNITGSKAADDAMPSKPVNAILERLFASEAAWLKHGSLPFGLSIVIIGRKA